MMDAGFGINPGTWIWVDYFQPCQHPKQKGQPTLPLPRNRKLPAIRQKFGLSYSATIFLIPGDLPGNVWIRLVSIRNDDMGIQRS